MEANQIKIGEELNTTIHYDVHRKAVWCELHCNEYSFYSKDYPIKVFLKKLGMKHYRVEA